MVLQSSFHHYIIISNLLQFNSVADGQTSLHKLVGLSIWLPVVYSQSRCTSLSADPSTALYYLSTIFDTGIEISTRSLGDNKERILLTTSISIDFGRAIFLFLINIRIAVSKLLNEN